MSGRCRHRPPVPPWGTSQASAKPPEVARQLRVRVKSATSGSSCGGKVVSTRGFREDRARAGVAGPGVGPRRGLSVGLRGVVARPALVEQPESDLYGRFGIALAGHEGDLEC